MYRNYVRSLSILEQAKMELLDDYLTFEEISILTLPDEMPAARKKLKDELMGHYEWGKLVARKGALNNNDRTLTLPDVSHKEAYPRIATNEDYWVHKDDFREFLQINDNWPIEGDLPLSRWFVVHNTARFYRDIEELPEEQQKIARKKWEIADDRTIKRINTRTEFVSEEREHELHQMIGEYYCRLRKEKEAKNDTSRIKCWD